MLPETKQAQELLIYADQIEALPAAICRALIRFLCVQVNL